MKKSLRFIDDLASLFYPRLCLACGTNLPPSTSLLCLSCQYRLPQTHYHLSKENPFTERFWGRVDVKSAAALYHYDKDGKVQRLVHQLKYKHQPDIGVELGKIFGRHLQASTYFQSLDGIVPVPLHPRKQHLRGYNQSECFARGLSASMGLPYYPHALARSQYTETQTAKTRLERMENVMQAFELARPEEVSGRRLLLVDDVLTTGATLEACSLALLSCPNTEVSLATIAIAGN